MTEPDTAPQTPPLLAIEGAVATITFNRPRYRNRIEPDIGHHVSKGQHAAAIDDDGEFGREGERSRRDGLAQRIGHRRRIGCLGGVDARERRNFDGDARLRHDAGGGKPFGKERHRGLRQAAKLEIASGGDFDEAVAVFAGKLGKGEQVLGRERRSDRA